MSVNKCTLKDRVVSSFRIKYPEFDKEKFLDIIKNGKLKDIRHLATSLSSYKGVNYDDEEEIILALNNKVKELLGTELNDLFDSLVSSQKHELWRGNERYTILMLDCPVAYVQKVLVSALYIKFKFLGKALEVEDIDSLRKICVDGLWFNIIQPQGINSNYNELRDVNFRQREVAKWVELTGYILRGELDKAYNVILRCLN